MCKQTKILYGAREKNNPKRKRSEKMEGPQKRQTGQVYERWELICGSEM